MKKNKLIKLISLFVFLSFLVLPSLVYGQNVGTKATFSTQTLGCKLTSSPLASGPHVGNLLNYITCLIGSSVIPLIFSLAIVVFIWGVVQFVMATDDEAKKKKGKEFMLWGIIALAVMVSVWGLVNIIGSTFGIKNVVPTLNTNTNTNININTSTGNSYESLPQISPIIDVIDGIPNDPFYTPNPAT